METSILFSTPEKIVIYVALGLCGLAIMCLALQMQRRLARASSALTLLGSLGQEWESAQSSFLEVADAARRKIGRLENTPPPDPGQGASIGFDMRSQVATMARRGMPPGAIAQATGLAEAEVDVLVGMSRIAVRKK